MDEKKHRTMQMNELQQMMSVQENEVLAKKENNLLMEKTLLKNLEKYDGHVEGIQAEKRKWMDKLRQERPF